MGDILSQRKLGLLPEGSHQRNPALGAAQLSAGFVGQLLPVAGTEVGQGVSFEMPPNVFRWIQFGRVGRQAGHDQATVGILDEVLNATAAMCGESVPDHQEASGKLPHQMAQKINDLGGADGAAIETEIESPPRDARDDGQFAPVEIERQLRGLSLGCPRARDGRAFAQSTFVHENDGSAFAAGFFLVLATCIASNGRWLSRPVRQPDLLASGSSTPSVPRASTRALDGSVLR